MSQARNYREGDKAALHLLSGGTCYWPNCPAPLTVKVEGRFRIALEIAHINAAEPGGPRYRPEMSDEERRCNENLILLCTPHHKAIDDRSDGAQKYPEAKLYEWKDAREERDDAPLVALTGVNEQRLVEQIEGAAQEREERFMTVLERIEGQDREAGALLRDLYTTVQNQENGHWYIDPETASMLSQAGNDLRNAEDSANLFSSAASDLRDVLGQINGAIDQMQNFRYR